MASYHNPAGQTNHIPVFHLHAWHALLELVMNFLRQAWHHSVTDGARLSNIILPLLVLLLPPLLSLPVKITLIIILKIIIFPPQYFYKHFVWLSHHVLKLKAQKLHLTLKIQIKSTGTVAGLMFQQGGPCRDSMRLFKHIAKTPCSPCGNVFLIRKLTRSFLPVLKIWGQEQWLDKPNKRCLCVC